MSTPLVLEYVFEGQQRGYNFTSPTHGYGEDILKSIWRQAMPRGQGWGQYTGAESLKCFPLANGHMAVSNVTVTDLQDESGRRGIRRAVIDMMTLPAYIEYLQNRFFELPKGIQNDTEYVLASWKRVRTLEREARKIQKAEQLILAHRFTTTADWKVMEGLVLRLALSPIHALKHGGGMFAFTTLALTHHDESFLVAMPLEKVQQIKTVPVITVH